MPFTPFHLGPALLIGLLCLRWFDLPTFLVASVVVDIRATLVFFGLLDGPLHGPLHTLVGATGLAIVLVVAMIPLRPHLERGLDALRVPQSAHTRTIVAAALVGCWLHVFLDAALYTDVHLFAPLSQSNPLLGLIGLPAVYLGCVVSGVAGLGLYVASLRGLVSLPVADSVDSQ